VLKGSGMTRRPSSPMIMRARAKAIGHQIEGITGGLEAK
jgi:hypothetical protein